MKCSRVAKSVLAFSLWGAAFSAPALAHGDPLFALLFSSCVVMETAVVMEASRPCVHYHRHYYKKEAQGLLKDIELFRRENVVSEALQNKISRLSKSPDPDIVGLDDKEKIALIELLSGSLNDEDSEDQGNEL